MHLNDSHHIYVKIYFIKNHIVVLLRNKRRRNNDMMTKIVHVQSVLLYEDMIALKAKTGESSIKEAISKAIYHYLNCGTSDRINPSHKEYS